MNVNLADSEEEFSLPTEGVPVDYSILKSFETHVVFSFLKKRYVYSL